MPQEIPEITNAFVSNNRLKLLRREKNGELKSWSVKAEYSVFVKKEDLPKLRNIIGKRAMTVEGDYVRIVFNDYNERDHAVRGFPDGDGFKPSLFEKAGVKTYEGDLSPVKRFLIDSRAKILKPIAGYLDLETDSRVSFARKEEARCLCWGFCIPTPNGLERFGGVLEEDTDEAEKELLMDLFFEMQAVDQVLAWNGDKFDFEYLKERVKYLGLDVQMKRWLWCDHMLLFMKYNMTASESGDEKASMALTSVAASLKVQGKLTDKGVGELEGVQVGGAKTWEFWNAGGRNRELLLEYCVEDAATMGRIDEATGFISILSTLAETCGVLPDSRGMSGMNFVESFLMRLGADRGIRAPTKFGFNSDNTEQFKGAHVFETMKGLFTDVHICDFARLYPSIMQAYNMSPDTYAGRAMSDKVNESGQRIPLDFDEACKVKAKGVAVCPITLEQFYVDRGRGLFAAALDEIVEKRKYWSKKKNDYAAGTPEWKECDRRDQAFKIIANTFYGVSGSPMSRFFMREVSESVTQIGVWLIQSTAKAGSDWRKKLTTVFGDTDSCAFVGCTEEEFVEFTRMCNEVLYPTMIKPTGGDASFISLAFEKSFSLMVNVAKKTYAGRMSHYKGKRVPMDAPPVIKGLEFKRGDTRKLTREMQEEVVNKILLIGKPIPEDYPLEPEDLVPIVEKWQKNIMSGNFDYKKAVISKKIQKPLNEYGGIGVNGKPLPLPPHVKIAKQLEAKGEAIYAGVKIDYVIIDGKASPQVIKRASEATIEDLDLFYLWEQGTWPASHRVLEAAFPTYKWNAKWGSVRPMKNVLPGQVGFNFGERQSLPPRKWE